MLMFLPVEKVSPLYFLTWLWSMWSPCLYMWCSTISKQIGMLDAVNVEQLKCYLCCFRTFPVIAVPERLLEEICQSIECLQWQCPQHLKETHHLSENEAVHLDLMSVTWRSSSFVHWNDCSDVMSWTRMSVPSLHILWLYPHEYSFPTRTQTKWGNRGFSLSSSH